MDLTHKKPTHTFQFSPNILKYCLIGLCFLFATLYIWQVNVASTHGYQMRDLEVAIDDMRRENQQLQFEVSSLQSIDSVTARVQMLGLTKADNVRYVKVGTETD